MTFLEDLRHVVEVFLRLYSRPSMKPMKPMSLGFKVLELGINGINSAEDFTPGDFFEDLCGFVIVLLVHLRENLVGLPAWLSTPAETGEPTQFLNDISERSRGLSSSLSSKIKTSSVYPGDLPSLAHEDVVLRSVPNYIPIAKQGIDKETLGEVGPLQDLMTFDLLSSDRTLHEAKVRTIIGHDQFDRGCDLHSRCFVDFPSEIFIDGLEVAGRTLGEKATSLLAFLPANQSHVMG